MCRRADCEKNLSSFVFVSSLNTLKFEVACFTPGRHFQVTFDTGKLQSTKRRDLDSCKTAYLGKDCLGYSHFKGVKLKKSTMLCRDNTLCRLHS